VAAELEQRELVVPHRRFTRAATWAIAAQLTRAAPSLVLDRVPTGWTDPELLRVHLGDEQHREWHREEAAVIFRHDTGISITSPDGLETIDWLDVLAQPFPDAVAGVLLDAVGRQAQDTDSPSDLQLVHDFVATLLAMEVDAPQEWSVDYTPREAIGTLLPLCTLRRDGDEVAHINLLDGRSGTRILNPVLPAGPWSSVLARNRRKGPIDLSAVFAQCDRDMLATVLMVVGETLAA